MKTQLHLFLITALLLTGISSCKKNDSEPDNSPDCDIYHSRVVKSTYNSSNGTPSTNVSLYDEQGRPKNYYIYSSDNDTAFLDTLQTSLTGELTTAFYVFNNGNQTISNNTTFNKDKDTIVVDIYHYHFDGERRLVNCERTRYGYEDGSIVTTYTTLTEYTWQDGNLVNEKDSTTGYVIEYEYDKNTNGWSMLNVPGTVVRWMGNPKVQITPSKNLIRKITSKSPSGEIYSVQESTYQFDGKERVRSADMVISYPNYNYPTIKNHESYEYECF